jgi:hypothetical protein
MFVLHSLYRPYRDCSKAVSLARLDQKIKSIQFQIEEQKRLSSIYQDLLKKTQDGTTYHNFSYIIESALSMADYLDFWHVHRLQTALRSAFPVRTEQEGHIRGIVCGRAVVSEQVSQF